jgi:type II secretory pathway component PulK
MRTEQGIRRTERGVALLIVLLVTALLIALIFEFAYGTRVSLRAAVNYRDSRRAYYLARSGVYVFAKYQELQDYVPQGEWGVVPMVSEGDQELRVRWEDEGGKVRIKDIKNRDGVARTMVERLFTEKGVSREVRDRLLDPESDVQKLALLSELHAYMSDQEYETVKRFLTVEGAGNRININTASAEVLGSMGISDGAVSLILDERAKAPFTDHAKTSAFPGISGVMIPLIDAAGNTLVANYLTETSNVLTVHSYATVGGYTKEVEAIITRPSGVRYWRAL